jgi:hypothetical protein
VVVTAVLGRKGDSDYAFIHKAYPIEMGIDADTHARRVVAAIANSDLLSVPTADRTSLGAGK